MAIQSFRHRSLVQGLLLSLTVVTVLGGVAAAEDAPLPRRKMLRIEVAKLRGEVARLASEIGFLQRGGGGEDSPAGPQPGGLCSDPCAFDSDADGLGDCEDPCPCDPASGDSDNDNWPDCYDPCPDDSTNACIDPCANDSDGDGLGDCVDPCLWDPSESTDSDGDGTPNCQDPCPDDIANVCIDPCLFDQDGDNVPDCKDECPWYSDTGEGGVIYPDRCWPVPMSRVR